MMHKYTARVQKFNAMRFREEGTPQALPRLVQRLKGQVHSSAMHLNSNLRAHLPNSNAGDVQDAVVRQGRHWREI